MDFSPLPTIALPAKRELVTAIRALVTGSGFGSLDTLGYQLRPRRSKQRLSELVRGQRLPDVNELRAVVDACDPFAWDRFKQLLYAAHAERAATKAAPLPRLADRAVVGAGERLPLVADFSNWARLRVHRPITRLSSGQDLSEQVEAGALPAYVEREKDRTQLRPILAAAASGASPPVRLVLISGESLSGKTRTAMEAMRAELPTWRLLIPRGADQLARLLDEQLNLRHTVVWLDEIQELLSQDLGVEQLDRLLDLPYGPTVLLATLRTDAENALRGTAAWLRLDREAHRITLQRRPPPAEFKRELARARELDDPWIAEARTKLEGRYGIAEWLAAGPQLLRELERARTSSGPIERTAAAIVDAAIDCYRAGYTTPIPEALLAEVHALFLANPITGVAAGTFVAALAWARRPIAGATGLLEHHRGQGDRAFDYLLGHADRTDGQDVDNRIWASLLRHLTPYLLPKVAQAADRHGRTDIADTLVSRADPLERALLQADRGDISALAAFAADGHRYAAWRFARLLAARGDIDTLTKRADNGDASASLQLHSLLADRGDISTLTARADNGDRFATVRLASLLAERGDLETLTSRADRGDDKAAVQLAWLLAKRGDVEQLVAHADRGDRDATWRLASLLAERGDTKALTIRAENGDEFAPAQLAQLLVDRGDIDTLTTRADSGDQDAADQLARLLVDRGDIETLTTRADSGDQRAARQLALLLTAAGDIDALTVRADMGDRNAADQLSWLFAARGDVAALTARAARGDPDATERLDELLDGQDDPAQRHAPTTTTRNGPSCSPNDATGPPEQ